MSVVELGLAAEAYAKSKGAKDDGPDLDDDAVDELLKLLDEDRNAREA